MKTHLVPHLVTVVFGLAVLSATAIAENQKIAQGAMAPSIAVTSITVTNPAPRAAYVVAPAPGPSSITVGASSPTGIIPVAAQPDAAPAQWAEVGNCTYDQRVQFFTGFKRLEAKVDDQMAG